jgi:hypothetical protein
MFEIIHAEVFDPADRATYPEGGDVCLVAIVPKNWRAMAGDLLTEGKMTLAVFSEGDPDYENDQAFFDVCNEEIKEAPEGYVLVYAVVVTDCTGFWWNQRGLEERRDRSRTQLTLGKLIEYLEAMPAESQVANLQAPHSYHGIFADLAFEQEPGTRPAAELLALCKEILGRDFHNRGGEYEMWEDAPLWIAERGRTGVKLKAIAPGGGIEVEYAEYHKPRG